MMRSHGGEGEPSTGSGLEVERPQKKPRTDYDDDDDVAVYLKKIKDTMLVHQKEEYDEFIKVMADFNANKIGETRVIEKVKELFKGHEDLISGFDNFMQKAREIKLALENKEEAQPEPEPQAEPEGIRFEISDALRFVGKLRRRFEGNRGMFESFLRILTLHGMGMKTYTETCQELASLLIDHPDLLQEFYSYFPPPRAFP